MSDLFMKTDDPFIRCFLPTFFFLFIIKFFSIVNSFIYFFKFCAIFLEPWRTYFLLRRARNHLIHLLNGCLRNLHNLISIDNSKGSSRTTIKLVVVIVNLILVRLLLLLLELLWLINISNILLLLLWITNIVIINLSYLLECTRLRRQLRFI